MAYWMGQKQTWGTCVPALNLRDSRRKRRPLRFWLVLPITIFLLAVLYFVATPNVIIEFSEHAKSPLGYIFDTQGRIFKRKLEPGGTTGDAGYIFPDKNFYMMLSYRYEGKNHCINIKPKWPEIVIYIGADGYVDSDRTHSDYYLDAC